MLNKTKIAIGLSLTALVFSVSAVRYQKNSLTVAYYADAAKTQLVGLKHLPCPIYANNNTSWIWVEGNTTTQYSKTQIGAKCTTGGAMGPVD